MGSLLCAYLLFDTHIVMTSYGRVLVQRPPRGGTWEMNAALQFFYRYIFHKHFLFTGRCNAPFICERLQTIYENKF